MRHALFLSLFPVLQEQLPCDEIVDHDHAGGADLGDHVEDPEQVYRDPHDKLIDPQSNEAQHDKHRKVLRLAAVP